MKLWCYYAFHTFINTIKKMFKSVVLVVIFTIFIIGIIFGVVFSVIDEAMPSDEEEEQIASEFLLVDAEGDLYTKHELYVDAKGNLRNDVEEAVGLMEVDAYLNKHEDVSQEDIEVYVWEKEEIEDSYVSLTGDEFDFDSDVWQTDLMSKEDLSDIKIVTEAVCELLLIVMVLIGIYSGSKKGSDIFLMADVNFLFTAPKKPQTVLMFRLSFQLAATILGMFYLLFQIPNLINLGLSASAIVGVFIGIILMVLLQKVVSVFSYTLTSTHEKLKRFVFPFVCVVGLVVAGITYITFMAKGKNFIDTAAALYGPSRGRWVPFFGWFKAGIISMVEGSYQMALLYGALFIVGMAVLVWGIWSLKADFYEDALSGAAQREEVLNAAKEGQQVKKKDRSDRIKRNGELKGEGASAFFFKEMYNRRRFSYFGIFTKTMITYFLVGGVMTAFCIRAFDVYNFAPVGVILAAILFFRAMGNPLAQESALNWLFLVPDEAHRKVFMSMCAGSLGCVIDLIPAILIYGIIMGENPLTLVLWAIAMLLLDFTLCSVSAMIGAVVPVDGIDQIKAMIQMIIIFLVLGILAVLFAVGIIFKGVNLALILWIAFCIPVGFLCFIVYPLMLHKGIG